MESDVVALLRFWREGALFMKSNGKSQCSWYIDG
jgi:hypothetical protein